MRPGCTKWTGMAILAILLGGTETSAQVAGTVDPVVGCYAVEVGEWRPAMREGDEEYQIPPDTVRLGSEPLAGSPTERPWMTVRPLIPEGPWGRSPVAYWSRNGPDSLRIVWSNGYVGVRMSLRIIDDGRLEGVAATFSDARREGVPFPSTGATLTPVECPASLESPRR